MRSILQNEIKPDALIHQVGGDLHDLEELLRHLYDGTLADRNRSMVILANRHGVRTSVISRFLGINRRTARKYLKAFAEAGISGLFAPRTSSNRKFDDSSVKSAVFELLHEPPSSYGINRTTWPMTHLVRILRERERPACPQVVRRIIKLAGYKWRKARIVLTSSDPTYSDKLNRIQSILSELRKDEAFFSIDEFGPFAVKTKSGLKLTAPGEQRLVPQWQKSRRCLILTAALELSENQVHHFFSAKKNTIEMIRMMDILIDRYRDHSKIYLSWDAAS
jgi:transposase